LAGGFRKQRVLCGRLAFEACVDFEEIFTKNSGKNLYTRKAIKSFYCFENMKYGRWKYWSFKFVFSCGLFLFQTNVCFSASKKKIRTRFLKNWLFLRVWIFIKESQVRLF